MILDKYQKFDLKNKIITALIVFALIIFALIYFIVMPAVADIQTISEKIEEQRIDLEKKYIKGQSLKQLTENLKKIEAKLSSLDQIFINRNRELEFITTIENEANKSQISQKINLSSPKETESQKFQKNSLQLSTSGGFNQQMNYLLNLESSSYYINVKSLEFTTGGSGAAQTEIISQDNSTGGSQTSSVNALINADTYWE